MNDRLDTMLILADADPTMGIGHVARCASLAAAWQASGGRAVGLGHLPNSLLESNFGKRLQQSKIEWEQTAATGINIDRLAAMQEKLAPQWVVIDGYHFSEQQISAARDVFQRVAIVDDSFTRADARPDVLLIPSPDAATSYHPLNEETLGLLGPRFMPLAADFQNGQQTAEAPRDHTIARVLVLTGGSDPARLTETMLDAAERIDTPLVMQIVVGPANPRIDEIQERVDALRCEDRQTKVDVELHFDPDNPVELMRAADLALTAAGGTCWELAALRVPTLLVATAENQRPNARWLDEEDAAVYLGDFEKLSADSIATSIQTQLAEAASKPSTSLPAIDGRGAQRTVAILRELIDNRQTDLGNYRVRPLQVEDSPILWRLANAPSIRRWSTHRNEITPKNHRSWFFGQLEDPENSRIWMLDLAGLPIGSIRYQRREKHVGPEAVISFQIASPLRGRGLGTSLMKSTLTAAVERLKVERMTAFVYRNNVASARCFEKLGFRRIESRSTRQKFCFELSADAAIQTAGDISEE